MRVAIIYNDYSAEYYAEKNAKEKRELGFDAYFDVEPYDPDSEFQAISDAIKKGGNDAYTLNIQDNLDIFLNNFKKERPDAIFNFVESYKEIPRLEMSFTGLLELLEVPYTGADPIALGTCQNKILTKLILKSEGIRVPGYFTSNDVSSYPKKLKYPFIVKPAFEDASVGIDNNAIVFDEESLLKRIEFVKNTYKQPSLIEEFIEGRELNVAVFGWNNPVALPISEIDFSLMPEGLNKIVSFQAKWDPFHEAYHKTIPICPARLSKKIQKEAEKTAVKAFKLMGCRDYARVDMRINDKNELYVLEVNPNPDLQEDAGFMRSAKAAGYSFSQTLKKIIDFALERKNMRQ